MNNIVVMDNKPQRAIGISLSHARRLLRYGVITAGLMFAVSLPFLLQKNGTLALSLVSHAQPVQNAATAPKVRPPVAQHGATAWSYNFADKPNGRLSSQDWNFETGVTAADYNNEDQAYTSSPANVRINNGTLIIEAKPQDLDGKKYTSARVNTQGKFDFTYGTFEADMKLPAGAGTWPAAWLLPANNTYKPADYGIAPTNKFAWALNGEIDFGEAIGSIPGQNIPAVHSYHEVQQAATYTPAYIPDSATAFHEYGVIKTPTKITFTIDGVPYASRVKTGNSVLDWPFDQPYYVVLDLAIGGSWAGAQGIDNSSAPWQLQIKSLSYTPL